MVTLRPPASMIPCAMMAPILVIVTSRSSMMWFVSRLRNGARFASNQGLTFVHFSAQRKRFLWDRGCNYGLFRGCFGGD